jgi:large subunit ribosomal protein L1
MAKKSDNQPVAASAPAAPNAAADAALDGSSKKRSHQPGHPPRIGRKLRLERAALRERISKEGAQPLRKAIASLKSVMKAMQSARRTGKRTGFNQTVEVHMNLGIDTTQADQMIRGSVGLPNGVGKSVRVLVFCQGENMVSAKKAGADFTGAEDLIKKIQDEGFTDFDVALATQDMMAKVIRLGKILGPRGLMPTPKAGTVIPTGSDVGSAVKEFKAGKVEYRADKGGNVHAGVGKMDFDDEKLAENITTFVEQIRGAKPTGVKGNYIQSITLAGTMTPGITVSM